ARLRADEEVALGWPPGDAFGTGEAVTGNAGKFTGGEVEDEDLALGGADVAETDRVVDALADEGHAAAGRRPGDRGGAGEAVAGEVGFDIGGEVDEVGTGEPALALDVETGEAG